jgi:PAS domain S-box-containing protein
MNGEVRWIHHLCQPIYDRDGRFLGVRGSNRDITMRKRAEEALRESEEKLRSFYDLPLIGMALTASDKRWIYANDRICEILGFSREELSRLTWDKITYPDDLDKDLEYFNRLLRGEIGSYTIEKRFVRKDSGIVHTQISIGCVRNPDHSIRYIAGLMQDITERKRAEEAVMLAGAYNRSLIEASLDPLVTISPDGVITDVNKATEAVTGYSREELIDTDFCDYFTEPEKAKDGYLTAFKQGSVTDYALEVRHRDGYITPIIYNASVYRDESGKVIGVFAAARDITERRRAEEALKKSEANLDRAQRIAALGNWEWDLKANRLSGSREYYRMFGFEYRESVPFEEFASMLHPEDRKWVDAVLKDIHYDNLPRCYEFRLLLPDGRERYIHSDVEVIYDESGRPVKIFGTMQDITERKQAENALRDAKDQVELYMDLMGHDINNMNQVSMGFLELAHNIIEMEGKLGEDNIVLLDKAMDSLKNSSQLIDNVRKLQREKMGLYEPEVLDVCSVIEDAIQQFRNVPGRDVRITCKPIKDSLVRANSLLKDVFVNLVGNAMKHSWGPLTVNIVVSRVLDNGKTYCRVDVEDNGPGIPDDLKNTLFDRLSLTATRARGKGFGLCLIKMLVDDYQGKFWVEDRVPGDHTKGARFVVLLPAAGKRL